MVLVERDVMPDDETTGQDAVVIDPDSPPPGDDPGQSPASVTPADPQDSANVNGLQQQDSDPDLRAQFDNLQQLLGQQAEELNRARALERAAASDPDLYGRLHDRMNGNAGDPYLPGVSEVGRDYPNDDQQPQPPYQQPPYQQPPYQQPPIPEGYDSYPNGGQFQAQPQFQQPDPLTQKVQHFMQGIHDMSPPEELTQSFMGLAQVMREEGKRAAMEEVQPYIQDQIDKDQDQQRADIETQWGVEHERLKNDLGVDIFDDPAENARINQVYQDLARNWPDGYVVPPNMVASAAYRDLYVELGKKQTASAEQVRQQGADAASQVSVAPTSSPAVAAAPGGGMSDYIRAAERHLMGQQ